ncbi:MAG: tetratricopeptide repeat protein [Bacteroidia bacterium]
MSKPKPKAKALPKQNLSPGNFLSGYEKYFLPAVLVITFIVFLPALQNRFVNLDDTQYIIENPVVKNINSENIKTIFSEQFVGNYQPVTMLSYMAEYKLFGLNPFGYHLMNLIFHLLGTLFVFLIIKKISGNNLIAFITSLLFGIHPLHVESVAWIAERKDVLYGFYFLWAFYLYVEALAPTRQLAEAEVRLSPFRVGAILLLFLLALLSKAQAVVLPIVFFTVDFLINRKFTRKSILEKVPFFFLAFAFGLIAINVQGKAGAMQSYEYFPFYERILFSCYALMTYLYKLILPIDLSCFYPYPETNDKINTVWVYISPAVLLALAFFIWKYFRTSKIILFGVAFFLITIILVLQLLPIGDALYADRYTYIPSIGLFFIASCFLVPKLKNKMVMIFSTAVLLLFCGLTFQRTKVWHDSIKLYTDALDKGYKAAIIYNNRGAAFSDEKNNEGALKDFTTLVELKPRYPNGWRNKGLVHERLGQKEEAIRSFSEEIKYFPQDKSNYFSRGTLLEGKNDFEEAIKDFSKVIELSPHNGEGYYARAEALGKMGKMQEALADINKAIEFSPEVGESYNNRGIIYSMSGKFPEAVNDFTKSLQLKPDNLGAYTNRALAYKGMGKYVEALQDMMTAKGKGIAVDENSINELKILSGKNQ